MEACEIVLVELHDTDTVNEGVNHRRNHERTQDETKVEPEGHRIVIRISIECGSSRHVQSRLAESRSGRELRLVAQRCRRRAKTRRQRYGGHFQRWPPHLPYVGSYKSRSSDDGVILPCDNG